MLAGRPCGRWVPLMGGTPATHRRSRCGSLATLPWVAFRPPPLTPAPPVERLRSMASRGRHRSAVRRTGPLAPGRRAPSCDAPHGSRLLGVGSTGAHLPGLALPWQPACPVQARYGFRCTESSCRLRRGRTAPKSLPPKEGPRRPLRLGPDAQSPRPFWFSSASRSSSQNALIAVAIPRSVKRTTMPLDRSTANPSLPPLTFLVVPSDFEW